MGAGGKRENYNLHERPPLKNVSTLALGNSSQFSLDIDAESLLGFAEGFQSYELDNSEYSDVFKTPSPLLAISGLYVGTSVNSGSSSEATAERSCPHMNIGNSRKVFTPYFLKFVSF